MSILRRFARRSRTVAHQDKKGWDLPSFKRVFSAHRFARSQQRRCRVILEAIALVRPQQTEELQVPPAEHRRLL